MMPCFPKDLLQLVFLELDHGRDMLNFSELNRKSHQIFQQQIKIGTNHRRDKYMKNIHHQKHGIHRGWHDDWQLYYEHNYIHGQLHGITLSWHWNEKLMYKHNWYRGQKHGISRGWDDDGQLNYEYNYYYGSQIEK